ncbi:S-adenosyl-L-methionine-dependent methyltransferase [Lentinus tigrinus ALCF2SS1-7]|uniref:S-adenosyl-L-methionine-dependent methyltransferase n=1 Tax=Lentinus tigrinus ALCF2SS1-6 TaxID=1328759 RepID=A0A5C2S4Y1_9APHY|nr:S-adenosyl-L-methionine-dependent methyltransferase [Lentinus tigrinus ALCF2SS1-6]RPD72291.1 S-adenosyl-L-methionine-dependent methyltransferase [Lentinus tigrinus ALCF2SS1-7]
MATLEYLRALHTTIGSALDDIERVYKSNNVDFPSLDAPLTIQDASSPSEALLKNDEIIKASNYLVAACGQLSTAVQNPFFTLMEGISACHVTSSIQILEASHTPEILRAAGSDGLHVDELARKIDEIRAVNGPVTRPLESWRLAHVLRLLATHQFVREVRPDVFASNRLTSLLDTGKTPEQIRDQPLSKYDDTNGVAALIPMCTNEAFRSIAYFSEWLLSPKEGTNYATPFNYAYQTNENCYEWYERPENALRLKQVGRAMSAGRQAEGNGSVTDKSVFPWDKLPTGSVIVDVGGGIGSMSVQLAEKYPQLRFIVQDRLQTVAVARDVWGTKHKDLFDSGRVTFQAQDFFEAQPTSYEVPGVGTVDNPAVFLVVRVMHNWSDKDCERILSHLRAAAGPDTKLIIVDQILPLACCDASESALAPPDSPLLPNLGKAYVASYHFDLTMMVQLGGKERTLREFSDLAAASGWQISNVARATGAIWAYTTLEPVGA